MQLSLILCTLIVVVGLAAPTVCAQGCPYTVSFTSYGSSCSNLSTSLPSLTGTFPIGNECDVRFSYDVPVIGVPVTHRWLVIGLAPASQPLPGGGCPLLVSALIINDLGVPLEGLLALQLFMPENPALIGLSVYVQGIDRRFDAGPGTQHFETTNGLRMDLL